MRECTACGQADERPWKLIDYETESTLPPEDVVVETRIDKSDGMPYQFCRLILIGRLWFLEDKSMYAYYTPTHWREVSHV